MKDGQEMEGDVKWKLGMRAWRGGGVREVNVEQGCGGEQGRG